MSFIRRSDGVIIYGSEHSKARSIKTNKITTDYELEKFLNPDDFNEETLENDDYDNIINLWGRYKRKIVKFNEKYFKPTHRC